MDVGKSLFDSGFPDGRIVIGTSGGLVYVIPESFKGSWTFCV